MFKKITALLVFMMALCILIGLTYYNGNYILSGVGENHLVYAQNSSTNITSEKTPNLTTKIKAETCTVDAKGFNLGEFLDDFSAKIVMVEDFGGGISYYAFSPKIKYLEVINGKKINLHIAVKKDSVKIGAPIIYTSF